MLNSGKDNDCLFCDPADVMSNAFGVLSVLNVDLTSQIATARVNRNDETEILLSFDLTTANDCHGFRAGNAH